VNKAFITSACNLTVKAVTRFAKKPAKQAPFLPLVEAGVEIDRFAL